MVFQVILLRKTLIQCLNYNFRPVFINIVEGKQQHCLGYQKYRNIYLSFSVQNSNEMQILETEKSIRKFEVVPLSLVRILIKCFQT